MMRYIRVMSLVTIAASLLVSWPVRSAPLEGDIITPILDTYTDRLQNLNGHNGKELLLSSSDPGPASGTATQVVFLKFDLRPQSAGGSLSNTLGSIVEARLNLAYPSCSSAAGLGVNVYPVADSNDGWDASLVWGTNQDSPSQPPRDTTTGVGADPLAVMDESAVTTTNVYYHWTDIDQATFGLAEWLQAQRSGGNGLATLRLEIAGGNGALAFEDSEGSAAGTVGCTVPAPGTPTLQLADSDSPLAVTVASFAASSPATSWPKNVGLLAGLGIVVGGALFLSRRRRRPPESR